MKLLKKKGQVQGIIGAIVMLVIGVGVSVLILIFIGSLSGGVYDVIEDDIEAIGLGSIANDNFTSSNLTAIPVTHPNIIPSSLSLEQHGSAIGIGNFTIDYTDGTFLGLGIDTTLNSTLNNTLINATYQWDNMSVRSPIRNSIISGFEALETTGNYLPIIVLAVVIALVLALIIGFTAFGGSGKGGSSAVL